jgi:zinc protease
MTPEAPSFRSETLANGLSVLLRESRLEPVSEVQIWVGVGSADERDHERGLAHFHEHMLFKGTATRGVGEIAGSVEGAGGSINAFTSFDATCYHATLPAEATLAGFDVLADAVQHSSFDPAEVTREIEVVLEEIRRSADEPHHVLGDALFDTAFRVHPYRFPVLGSAESVASFTREKLLAFYRRWYTPEHMVVVAAGDIDAEAFLARVREAFASAPRGEARRLREPEPAQSALRTRLLARPFERASLELSWPAVSLTHPDAPLLDLLAFALGDGDSSRLHRRVKEELGLADRVDASCYTPVDAGIFGISIDSDAEQAPHAIAASIAETERLRCEPLGTDELAKARRNFLASRAWERESVSGMARKLGSAQLMAGDPGFEEAYLARIATATREELVRAAAHWLDPARLSVVGVLPEGAPLLPAAELEAAVASGVSRNKRRFAAPQRAAKGERVHAYVLPNGARAFVLPRREVPVVAVRAAMLGGQLAETEETAGLGSFLAGVWLRGTAARGAAEFARTTESLAADIDAFSGRSSVGLTLDCTSEVFAEMLPLWAEALCFPAFGEEEVERERRDALAALERREDRLGARAFDLFQRAHYQRHPYRLPLPGTPESVARFDADALVAHHARLVRPENLVVSVLGDVDPDAAASALARELADLEQNGAKPLALPEPEPAPQEIRSALERKDRAQAHLVLGFRGVAVDDPDREALEVLTQILAGQGGRLFLELRDRQSLAYSVSAANVVGYAPGYFCVYIATAPEKLETAKRGVLAELERVLQDAPGDDEAERARRYLCGSHAIAQQRGGQRALTMALDARYGLGVDADREFPARVRAVGRGDLLRVARRILDMRAYTIATIEPGSPSV